MPLEKQPRLSELLASGKGWIDVVCSFFRDDEYRSIVAIDISGAVQVTCQRCLEAMSVDINASNELAVVLNDDQAKQLPGRLEPLLVTDTDEADNLWSIAEDEVILALPIVSYHDTAECRQLLQDYTEPTDIEQPSARSGERENPFKVLAQLKPSQENQEF